MCIRDRVKQRQLLAEAWDPAYTTETHYLRPYMTQLRRKLEPNPARLGTCSPTPAWGTAPASKTALGDRWLTAHRRGAPATERRSTRLTHRLARLAHHHVPATVDAQFSARRTMTCRMTTCRMLTWERRRGHRMIWRPEDGPVAVTGARAPVPGRWRTGRAARLAGAGLVVVLACLATFVLWSLAATSQLEQRVELTSTVADGYQQARTGAATEAAMEREYRLEPGPQSRAYFAAAADQLQSGLDQVQRRGNAQDRMAVAQLTAAHEGYRLAVAGMFAAVDRGDAPAAVRLAVRDVAPWAVALRDQVWDVAESHRAESLRDLAAMRHLQRLSEQLTPVVFLGGLIMLILFTMVLRGYRGTLQRQQAQALHDALHDALTGLPNRSLLVDRCDQALRQGRRQGTVSGLLLLDLDRFKEVNDALGQACGDALLVQVGTRLTECIREMDTVARLGADEYAVLMPAVGSLPAALSAASRLRQAIESPFRLGDVDVDVEVSVGVAVSDSSMTDAATLLQQADSAMYAAKQQHL